METLRKYLQLENNYKLNGMQTINGTSTYEHKPIFKCGSVPLICINAFFSTDELRVSID